MICWSVIRRPMIQVHFCSHCLYSLTLGSGTGGEVQAELSTVLPHCSSLRESGCPGVSIVHYIIVMSWGM